MSTRKHRARRAGYAAEHSPPVDGKAMPGLAEGDADPAPATTPEAPGVAGAPSDPAATVVAAPEPVTPPIERARELEASEDFQGALAVYRELLYKDQNDIEARLGMALLHDRLGQQALALEQLEAARGADPENVVVLTHLGAVLGALGKYQEAERELRRAERLAPERADAFVVLGTLFFKRGLYAQADQELARALEHDAESATAYHYRGEALHQLDRLDEALEMLMRAVDLDPRNARAYHTLGIIYDRKHMRAEAAEMYRRGREASAA
jgi:Tfp pilus assembly protein PilF